MADYRLKYLRLRQSMRDQAYLAERNYGVALHPRRHKTLIAECAAQAKVLRKLLAEKIDG